MGELFTFYVPFHSFPNGGGDVACKSASWRRRLPREGIAACAATPNTPETDHISDGEAASARLPDVIPAILFVGSYMPHTEPLAPPRKPNESPEPAPRRRETPPQPKPKVDPFNPDWPKTRPTPQPKALGQ
jgi:hypothetical protein